MTKLIMEKLAYAKLLKMYTQIKCEAQIELDGMPIPTENTSAFIKDSIRRLNETIETDDKQIELVNNRLFPPLRVFNWDFSKVIRR